MVKSKRAKFAYLDTSSWNRLFELVSESSSLYGRFRDAASIGDVRFFFSEQIVEELAGGITSNPCKIRKICACVLELCNHNVSKRFWTLVASEVEAWRVGERRPDFLDQGPEGAQMVSVLRALAEQNSYSPPELEEAILIARESKKRSKRFFDKARRKLQDELRRGPTCDNFRSFWSRAQRTALFRNWFYEQVETWIARSRPGFTVDRKMPLARCPSLQHFMRYLFWLSWAGVYRNRKAKPSDRSDLYHFAFSSCADFFVTEDRELRRVSDEVGRRSTQAVTLVQFAQSLRRGLWHR